MQINCEKIVVKFIPPDISYFNKDRFEIRIFIHFKPPLYWEKYFNRLTFKDCEVINKILENKNEILLNKDNSDKDVQEIIKMKTFIFSDIIPESNFEQLKEIKYHYDGLKKIYKYEN